MNFYGASSFIDNYPEMHYGPVKAEGFSLIGTFDFIGNYKGLISIEDSYDLEIVVPDNFPYSLPIVMEKGGKIPRSEEFHINYDNTLCVATPLRASLDLSTKPNLSAYADKYLVPYLYAVSYKLHFGGDFVFGELEHGRNGIIKDYMDLLEIKDPYKILPSLKLLSNKKRVANKMECACGCSKRLGVCNFRLKINELRSKAPRSYFNYYYQLLK
ncbi:hypothetical protein ACP3TN_15240 [Staphylococcus sp. IPLA37011]|uniref:hypothetical protein n=1 Tax=Staphylococcus TaxID=1279 RepID=UPI0025536B02|nr:hypothetical protein [Staphylococcus equorum]MDK9873078.1 hypothetical protein [Staphylococcus equorum]